jgi:beta-phosphoglucomutase
MTNLKGLIFDADGVVLNTPHREIWSLAANFFGINRLSVEEYDSLASGISRKDGAKKIFDYFKIPYDDTKIEQFIKIKQKLNVEYICEGKVNLFDDTLDLILDAHSMGYALSIASSSENARLILDRNYLHPFRFGAPPTKKYYHSDSEGDSSEIPVSVLFKSIISGGIYPGKPDPKIFLTSAQNIGLNPHECIVFEDAISGVEAAKKGGFYCVGLDRTGIAKELYEKGADFVVSNLSKTSLSEIVQKYTDKNLCEGN